MIVDPATAACLYSALTGVVILFQLALALGAPWGEMSMGGRFPGKYPPQMRVVALVNMVILSTVALIVLIRAGLLFPSYLRFSESAIWFVVVFSLVSVVLNTITPSKKERILWAPVTLVMFLTSVEVAWS